MLRIKTFFLIAGLGNPGESYRDHKHNVGFWAVERLAQIGGLSWTQGPGPLLQAQGRLRDHELLLVKPLTFMNLSGQAVAAAQKRLNLGLEQIVVLHDDLDLDLGRLQLRRGGGDGGHRGIRSVTSELGSSDFGRIRMGVGRPPENAESAEHVLSGFEPAQLDLARAMAERAAEATLVWMLEGLNAARNRFNPWKRPEPKLEETSTDAGHEPGDAIS